MGTLFQRAGLTVEPAEPAEERLSHSAKRWAAVDPTDPIVRSLHGSIWPIDRQLSSLPHQIPADSVVVATSRVSLEQLLPKLVRRVAWSGDAQSGTARLEFGQGALEGATLTIRSDRGQLRVHLELPPGGDAVEWRQRIASRLGARGLQVAELEVR